MKTTCLPHEFRCNGAGIRDNDAGFHVFDRIA